ncbi:MAG: hypothetical protein ACR2OT_02305 [Parvibaculales bacterium]
MTDMQLSQTRRVLLVLNGLGLFLTAIIVGWFYMFFLLGAVDLWPFVTDVEVKIGGDRRAWNMAHLEGITNGLMLLALAAVAPYIRLGATAQTILFWSWLAFAWLFTLPAVANALFSTRGLEYGGGPFSGDVVTNNIIFLTGWPAVIGVHIGIPLAIFGAWRFYKEGRA